MSHYSVRCIICPRLLASPGKLFPEKTLLRTRGLASLPRVDGGSLSQVSEATGHSLRLYGLGFVFVSLPRRPGHPSFSVASRAPGRGWTTGGVRGPGARAGRGVEHNKGLRGSTRARPGGGVRVARTSNQHTGDLRRNGAPGVPSGGRWTRVALPEASAAGALPVLPRPTARPPPPEASGHRTDTRGRGRTLETEEGGEGVGSLPSRRCRPATRAHPDASCATPASPTTPTRTGHPRATRPSAFE